MRVPTEELLPELKAKLKQQMAEGRRLQATIERNLDVVAPERDGGGQLR